MTPMETLRDDLVNTLDLSQKTLKEITDKKIQDTCKIVITQIITSIIDTIDNELLSLEQEQRKNDTVYGYAQGYDEDLAIYTLENLLGQFDMEIDLPNDKDVDGDPYWTVEQENGYISDIYYIKEKNFPLYTITIVTIWGGE